jgi:bisphosphoglycerate-independent phosphoglycerate mutase (AlkP superfamily)
VKSWSGDHCVDPEVVPGVIFSSLDYEAEKPRITDLAPTILELLGVEPPGYMTGRSLRPELSAEPESGEWPEEEEE